MRDPYEILGVSRKATADEIRKAYRKLAKEYHPDLHPGDAAAEAKFKEISGAHGLLSDPEKRKRFDRGEIDATGAERPQHTFYRGFADAPGAGKYHTTEVFGDAADLEKMFGDLFGARTGRGGHAFRMRGPDLSYTLEVDFLDAVRGSRRTVTMPDGKSLRITIPAGVRDRQTLRLKGKGGLGMGGGEAGDAFVEIHVRPHPHFTRKDGNIHVEVPVTPAEAMRGARITVPTVSGPVTVTVPKGSNTGTTLRLKGKGTPAAGGRPAGDQYVRLKVVLPKGADEELAAFVADWEKRHPFNPRESLAAETVR